MDDKTDRTLPPMNILLFSGLSDHKLISKIAPLVELESVQNIFLIRNTPLQFKKVRSFSPPGFLNIVIVREIYKIIKGIQICATGQINFLCGLFLRPHGLFAYWLGKLFRKPVIQIFIGNDVDFILKYKALFKRLLNTAHRIGVRGENSRNRLNVLVRNESKFFIHHNIYALNKHEDNRTVQQDIDVLCIADFSKVKRIDILLRVIADIKKEIPSVYAVMVGGGRRQYIYARMLKRLNLVNNVCFMGIVKDVFSYLKRSRVFILTSEAEGLPMAMIEAMSAGVPCVVSDVGDITDIADDGKNAFIIPFQNVEEYAEKVVLLLQKSDIAEQFSREARRTLQKKKEVFSMLHNKNVWKEILG